MWFSWSLGLEFCLVWCPLGPDPCQPRCLFVLSLSLVVWFVRRRRFLSFSLSLSRSGAGETQTPLGFGFPLVFSSSCTRTSSSTRTSCSTSTPRSPARLVFFFFSSLALGCGRYNWLKASLSSCLHQLHADSSDTEGVAYQTAPPFMIVIMFCVLGGFEHRAVSRTFRPEPLVLPPPPPAVP